MILQKTSLSKAQLSSNFSHCHPGAALGPISVPSGVHTGLALLLAAQLALLILFPLLGHHSPPLDVTEIHTWAVAPQLGYYKHPPLPAWGLFLSEAMFGRTRLALFVPGALSIALATLAVWPLALRFLGPRRALAALFLQSTVLYYNLYAPDYNHNVAQMPFWALAVTAFYFAVGEGGKRWWFAFGAALGLTALGKYSAAFLPLGCLALLVWDRQARRHLNAVNLLCAAAGFLLLFGPHLAWLVAHDFAPLRYVHDRLDDLAAHASWAERFNSYVGAQLIAHVVLLVVLLICMVGKAPGQERSPATRLDHRFLLALGLGPFIATLVVGLSGSYLHPMWASAMFPLSGLLAVRALGPRADRLLGRGWLAAWLALMLLFGAGYAVKNSAVWPSLTKNYARAAYPGPELARLLEARWHEEVPDRPLRTVVGTAWEASVASFFMKADTRVLIGADFATSPWVTPEDIARCGAIVTWDPWNPAIDFPAILHAKFPTLKMLPRLDVDPDRPGTYYRKGVGAAVILPAAGSPAAACVARR